MRASERVRGRYWGAAESVGLPEGDCSCADIAGRASRRVFVSNVGDGGGDGESVVVYL